MFGNENNMMQGVMPTMGGYAYQGMAQPVQKFNNALTPEQIKKLQQKGEQFSLSITEEEWLRGVCNHRNAEGTADTLVFDPLTGEARCTICGYKFRPIEADVSPDEIKQDVERIVDILQTIKLMYIDLPPAAAKEYFQIIPLIGKIPQLFDFAMKNMTKHETYNWQYNNRNMGAINMFNNLQSMFSNGMMGQPMQQPQPGYYQQTPYNMGMNNGQEFVAPTNGFGYPGAGMTMGNPAFQQQGYQPVAPGFSYTPNPQASTVPAQPTVNAPEAPKPTEATETTVTQKVTV